MWAEILTTTQLAELKKDDEILHYPADGGNRTVLPTGKENNSRIYRIQSIEDDLVILYTTGILNDRPHYSSTGIELPTLLNGRWWMRKKS